jgi:ABC-type uncharacterized transport system auxiliary subunit
MKSPIKYPGLLAAAGSLLLSACASSPVPVDMFYDLAPVSAKVALNSNAKIMVEVFQAHGIYAERSLLIRSSGALRQSSQSFWAEPPTLMLSLALVDTLRDMGLSEVFTPDSRVRPDTIIRTRIRRLELMLDGEARSILGLEFVVSDASGRTLTTLLFEREQVLENGDFSSHVQAVNDLLGQAYTALGQELSDKLGEKRKP